MTKSLFEQLDGTYHEESGYLIPDLRLPVEEKQPMGEIFAAFYNIEIDKPHRLNYNQVI